jgi:transcriptional regulator with XRE-family HTH domain
MKGRVPNEQALAELAKRVSMRLTFHGITQKEVADRTGVSQGTVSKWLSGKPPGLRTLPKLAEVLGVSVEYLLTGKEPSNARAIADLEAEVLRLRKELARMHNVAAELLGAPDASRSSKRQP